jgi:hypothetical protein
MSLNIKHWSACLVQVSFTLIFFACQDHGKKNEPVQQASGAAVGNEKGAQGCISSAGYTWSVIKDSCVRLFEAGIRLDPQDSTLDQTTSAYIIFNADRTKAELFMPKQQNSIILQRSEAEESALWELGNIRLYPFNGYILKDGAKTIYQGE